ncbi:MAG: hypothetical protein ABR585_04945 [Gemmatimonadaceae bacterium]
MGYAAAASSPLLMERAHGISVMPDFDAIVDRLIGTAAALAEKWKNNPYVGVEGFELEVAFPPSLKVQFRFKEGPSRPPAGAR